MRAIEKPSLKRNVERIFTRLISAERDQICPSWTLLFLSRWSALVKSLRVNAGSLISSSDRHITGKNSLCTNNRWSLFTWISWPSRKRRRRGFSSIIEMFEWQHHKWHYWFHPSCYCQYRDEQCNPYRTHRPQRLQWVRKHFHNCPQPTNSHSRSQHLGLYSFEGHCQSQQRLFHWSRWSRSDPPMHWLSTTSRVERSINFERTSKPNIERKEWRHCSNFDFRQLLYLCEDQTFNRCPSQRSMWSSSSYPC